MVMLVVHLWLTAINTFFSRFPDQPEQFIVSRVSEIVYSVVFASSILVTLGYYGFAITDNLSRAWLAQIGDLHRHFLNSLAILIDLFLLQRAVHLIDFVYIASYFFCYIFTSIIYWSQNTINNVVYRQLDFNKPSEAIFFLSAALITSLILHVCHFIFSKIKQH
jgi:hypothetical protein